MEIVYILTCSVVVLIIVVIILIIRTNKERKERLDFFERFIMIDEFGSPYITISMDGENIKDVKARKELAQKIENYYHDIDKYPDGEKEGYVLELINDYEKNI